MHRVPKIFDRDFPLDSRVCTSEVMAVDDESVGVTATDGSLRDREACVCFEVCWFDFLSDGKLGTIPHLHIPHLFEEHCQYTNATAPTGRRKHQAAWWCSD